MSLSKDGKVKTIYIQNGEFIINISGLENSRMMYGCFFGRIGHSIGFYEEEMQALKEITNCDSIEELNGMTLKGLVQVWYGELSQFPVFLGIGYGDSFILHKSHLTNEQESVKVEILNIDQICEKLNCNNVIDFTKKEKVKKIQINKDNPTDFYYVHVEEGKK